MRELVRDNNANWGIILALLGGGLGVLIVAILLVGFWIFLIIVGIILAYLTYRGTPEGHPKRWVWVYFGFSIIGFIIWKLWGPGQNAELLR